MARYSEDRSGNSVCSFCGKSQGEVCKCTVEAGYVGERSKISFSVCCRMPATMSRAPLAPKVTIENTGRHGLPEWDQIGEAVQDRQLQLIHGRIGKPVGDRLRLRRQVPPVAVDVQ